MNKMFKIIGIISCVMVAFSLSAKAERLPSILKLKGKCIIIPTYNNGCDEFPLVYPKDCFYTGNSSKKLRINEVFIGVPISIDDVTILNKGKKSETLCILISKNGQSFSIVVPWGMEEKPKETRMFESLFCNYKSHEPENILVKCYEYEPIERIERNKIGKQTTNKYLGIPKGITFNRFVFVPTCETTEGAYCWDSLYAEFGDDIKNVTYEISTIDENDRYTLSNIENLFKE